MPTTKPRRAALPQSVLDAIDAAHEAGELDEGSDTGRTEVHVHMHGGAPAASGKPRKAGRTSDNISGTEQVSGVGDEDPDDEKKKEMKEVKDSIKAIGDTVAELAKSVKDMLGGAGPVTTTGDAEEEDDEGKGRTGDSAALEVGFRQLMADAEVLVPGFALPTFDSKVKRKLTVDSMCATRRRVLDTMYATADGKSLLDMLTGSATSAHATMDCKQTAILFRSAAGSKKAINNNTATRDSRGLPVAVPARGTGGNTGFKPVMSIAELNAANRKLYPVKA